MIIPTYLFVLLVIVLAIVFGRAGTVLREMLDHQHS